MTRMPPASPPNRANPIADGAAGAQGAPHSPAELSKLRSALLKRTRGLQEPCVVPEKLLQRIDVGGEGALAISFSHSGHILASMYYIVLEYITVL